MDIVTTLVCFNIGLHKPYLKNTALPHSELLKHHHWYKKKPFSSISAILYDFLQANDLLIANFSFQQSINYTNHRGETKLYIDHTMVPEHLLDSVKEVCYITNDENLSDHLAVECEIILQCKETNNDKSSVLVPTIPKLDWRDPKMQRFYC